VDWTNSDTKAIAEFIENEDREWIKSGKAGAAFWQGTANEVLDDCEKFKAPPGAEIIRMTDMLHYLFCGESGEPVQTGKIADIKFSRVDWKQIAEWLLEKSRSDRSE
jgi:hypothetical protein